MAVGLTIGTIYLFLAVLCFQLAKSSMQITKVFANTTVKESPVPVTTTYSVEKWAGTMFKILANDSYTRYSLLDAPTLQLVEIERTNSVSALIIRGCLLTDMPAVVNIPMVWKIEITFCRLRHLELGSLVNLRRLLVMKLNHNQITRIEPTAVPLRLQHFSLTNNNLSHLDAGVFAPMKELFFLDLSFNQLVEIVSTNTSLPVLQMLSLSHNRLPMLNFVNWSMPQLKTLHCSSNRFTAPPAKWNSLPRLHVLDLSLNQLDTFPMDDLYLSELGVLNLTGNTLTNVSTSKKRLLVPLKRLLLSSNRLTRLAVNRWNMPKLWDFSVAHNQLTELGDVFHRFATLHDRLDLRNNSWSCGWLLRVHPADLWQRDYGLLTTNASCSDRTLVFTDWKHPDREPHKICCHEHERNWALMRPPGG
ncbi:phospholipase A2 inhibitor beta-like [Anopheles cruzii]|uniref:phospholipase A2 inhibitor beta-like n=1 Tax=Anopheles cruzii TaxID=68878 RepID=UPI0022EC9144|nr:phospholipase A2 inhibitor beta-like [Anopheles cruzii]